VATKGANTGGRGPDRWNIAAMPDLEVGDAMPDVTLTGPKGPVKLRDHLGKPLVVYFYPADDTYGCTIEACAFRDQYEDFTAAGAEVIGISRDDSTSHDAFKTKHRLPFTLLTDPGGDVAKAWGGARDPRDRRSRHLDLRQDRHRQAQVRFEGPVPAR
jgi:peroxiredoxin